MANVVNLEKIVSYVFESEIESQPDEVTRESKRKSCYEGTREQLNQIFKNLGFHTNLIKDENQGFADKGSYIIPREDGQFIEWLISILNTDDGKALKAGNFSKCDHEVTRKLIDGLISILQHLDVNEEVIELQKIIKSGVLSNIQSIHRITIDGAVERKKHREERERL